MEFIPKNRIFEFNPNQMKLVRKRYNLDKPGDMDRAIDVLDAWIKQQKHFTKKEFPRSYMEKAILASKGTLERAKCRLDRLCTFRTMIPDFFGDNLTRNKFDNMDAFKTVILPKPANENYRVCIIKSIGKIFSTPQILDVYRYYVLCCEYTMAHDYNDGVIVIADCSETNLIEMCKALNLTNVRQIIQIIIEAFGMRAKGIHVITQSNAVDTLLTIVKQVLSPKVSKLICVHKDISTLYQYVPKELFPIDYGGEEKPFLLLHDDLRNELTGKDFLRYIEEMNEAKTDESYRDTDTFNDQYLGVPGSFRTLNVD